MSTFDIVILSVVGLSLGFSFFKGMIREIFSLLAYFTGYFCANQFNVEVSVYLEQFITSKTTANIFGFFLVFIGVSIAVKLVGKLFKNLMAASGMSTFDRLVGAFLGVVKAVFFLSLGMMVLELFPDLDKKVTEGSQVAPILRQTSIIVKQNMFSKDAIDKGSKAIGNFKEQVDALKQLNEIAQPSGTENPQDSHSQHSKEQLVRILKAAQIK